MYVKPRIEEVKIEIEDIIATSGINVKDSANGDENSTNVFDFLGR